MSTSLDLGSLRDAVASLEASVGVVADADWFNAQSKAVQNTLVAGVVQNFEFVYELSFKMVRRQIEAESDTPDEVDAYSFKDVLRVAAERGLITDVEAWFGYRKMRGTTSHTYDHEKALEVYRHTQRFLVDARALLAALTARNV